MDDRHGRVTFDCEGRRKQMRRRRQRRRIRTRSALPCRRVGRFDDARDDARDDDDDDNDGERGRRRQRDRWDRRDSEEYYYEDYDEVDLRRGMADAIPERRFVQGMAEEEDGGPAGARPPMRLSASEEEEKEEVDDVGEEGCGTRGDDGLARVDYRSRDTTINLKPAMETATATTTTKTMTVTVTAIGLWELWLRSPTDGIVPLVISSRCFCEGGGCW